MDARRIFHVVISILGLNFDKLSAPLSIISIYQVATLGFGFYASFYSKFMKFKKLPLDIYFIIDTIQIELLYTLQVILILRFLHKRDLQKRIFEKISHELWSKEKKSNAAEKRFIRNFLVIVFIRIVKINLASGLTESFTKKQMCPELLLASSDFLFQFYITKLIQHVKFIRQNLESGQKFGFCLRERTQILRNFKIKRDIHDRYSLDIFVTIAYNFMQLVIALYFISMRMKFHHLSKPSRELKLGDF